VKPPRPGAGRQLESNRPYLAELGGAEVPQLPRHHPLGALQYGPGMPGPYGLLPALRATVTLGVAR
jgi:hypothetical protein